MQITETRKAIIELISEYMDKTLSEGCLIGTSRNDAYYGPNTGIIEYKRKVCEGYKEDGITYRSVDVLVSYDNSRHIESIDENKMKYFHLAGANYQYIFFDKPKGFEDGDGRWFYLTKLTNISGRKKIGLYATKADKILGHYDITAVLKYINKYGCYRDVIGGEKISIMYGNELEPMEDFIGNKPLHLYTEEEDKQLLDLLLKLK